MGIFSTGRVSRMNNIELIPEIIDLTLKIKDINSYRYNMLLNNVKCHIITDDDWLFINTSLHDLTVYSYNEFHHNNYINSIIVENDTSISIWNVNISSTNRLVYNEKEFEYSNKDDILYVGMNLPDILITLYNLQKTINRGDNYYIRIENVSIIPDLLAEFKRILSSTGERDVRFYC